MVREDDALKTCVEKVAVSKRTKRSGMCMVEGCETTRHFGYDGEKARFCFHHKV